MQKRAFIIHGWEGYPEEGWFPWLKRELEQRNFGVMVPAMPDPATPQLDAWVGHLASLVGTPDEHTYFVGHSMGCRAILRYLEMLPETARIGGVVLVAGWVVLTTAAMRTSKEQKIVRQWLSRPPDWERMRRSTNSFTAIFSDSDEYVPLENWDAYRNHLGAQIIIEHGKGHFSGSDGVTKLPSALTAILKYAETH